MRVHVLGSSGTYPVPGCPTSGFVIEEGSTRIVCDLGPGTFIPLVTRFDLAEISAVVISHRHIDHCADLLALYHALAWDPRVDIRMRLFATEDTIAAIAGFLDVGPDDAFWRVFDIAPLEVAEIGSLSLRFTEAYHSVPSLVVRADGAHRSVVYTGDTGLGGTWEDIATGADLLLAEASFQGDDPEWPYHLTALEAGRIARRRQSKRLALTHVKPHLDPTISVVEAEQTFDRPVTLAVPGAIIEI